MCLYSQLKRPRSHLLGLTVLVQTIMFTRLARKTDASGAYDGSNAIFALAKADGRLFAGKRDGEIGVFNRWSEAQREARAFEVHGNDRGTSYSAPGARHQCLLVASPCMFASVAGRRLRRSRGVIENQTDDFPLLCPKCRRHPPQGCCSRREGERKRSVYAVRNRFRLVRLMRCVSSSTQVAGSWELVKTLKGHSDRVEALQVLSI